MTDQFWILDDDDISKGPVNDPTGLVMGVRRAVGSKAGKLKALPSLNRTVAEPKHKRVMQRGF